MHGLHTSVLLAAGVILVAAVGVLLWLPARHRDEAEAVAPVEDGGRRARWPAAGADSAAVIATGETP